MAWAQQLTDHNPQQAEDLVHDVFVKFALTRPELQRIDNLDGYLYTALRNTYRSQIRRAGRGSTRRLGLLDYESAELSQSSSDSRDRVAMVFGAGIKRLGLGGAARRADAHPR